MCAVLEPNISSTQSPLGLATSLYPTSKTTYSDRQRKFRVVAEPGNPNQRSLASKNHLYTQDLNLRDLNT